MRKNIFCILLMLMMLVSLSSCDESDKDGVKTSENPKSSGSVEPFGDGGKSGIGSGKETTNLPNEEGSKPDKGDNTPAADSSDKGDITGIGDGTDKTKQEITDKDVEKAAEDFVGAIKEFEYDDAAELVEGNYTAPYEDKDDVVDAVKAKAVKKGNKHGDYMEDLIEELAELYADSIEVSEVESAEDGTYTFKVTYTYIDISDFEKDVLKKAGENIDSDKPYIEIVKKAMTDVVKQYFKDSQNVAAVTLSIKTDKDGKAVISKDGIIELFDIVSCEHSPFKGLLYK